MKNIYEIYIDSLFLINFVMNLYFYMLTAKILKRTATRLGIVAGSFMGAGLSCSLILIPGIPIFIKRLVGPLIISMAMTSAVFKIKQIREIFRCTGYMFICAFLFGGIMKFLFSSVPFLHNRQDSIWLIMGIGIIGYQLISWWILQTGKKKVKVICDVRLLGNENEVKVKALIDTGNSLREPITEKPVSIIEKEILELLKETALPEKFKMIPYHSVGKANGMMEGYEIPGIIIEDEEGNIRWQKVIVGICKDKISAGGEYQMILHPDLYNMAAHRAERHW